MPFRPKHILVCFISFLSAFLSAEEFRFTGFYDYFGGIEPSEGYENLDKRVYMNPSFSGYADNSGLEWTLSARLLVDPEGDTSSLDPWDILGEAYFFLPYGNFDFLLGQKIVTYGFADIYGPLNAANSANRATLSLDEKYDSRRPDPLFQIKYYPTFSDTFELTYIPVTRPDKEQDSPVYLSETSDSVNWSDDSYITESLHNVFIVYSRYGEKMDWQFLYGNYMENTPDFDISSIDGSPSVLEAVYNRKQTIGFAYSTGIGNTTLSQDLALNITSDWEGTDLGAQNSDITVNTQILANLKGNILSQTSLVYSYIINFGNYDDGGDGDSADYLAEAIQGFHTQPVQHVAFIVEHLEKSFLRERLKAQLNIGLFYPNLYIAPRASLSITDYWSFETGADVILADPPEDEFRRNPSDDNYYLRIIYRY